MKNYLFFILTTLFSAFCNAQTVNIGDILCTDGTTVSIAAFPASGKTAMGVVFYVDKTDSHGWAVSLNNQSSSIKWCSSDHYGYDIPDLPNQGNARIAMHDLNGKQNTASIRSAGNANDFPAVWAVDYDNGWYLPSAGQLRYLFSFAPEINASLQVVGGATIPYNSNHYWWSSTEFSEYHAYDMNTGGSLGDYVKDNHSNYPQNGIAVRQIRDFEIQHPVHPTYHLGDLVTNEDGSQGILFYLSPDQSDGWMVALEDASTSATWGSGDVPNLANQTSSTPYGWLLNETDGFANTGAIRSHQAGLNTAANTVDYEHGWYLPTAGQLSKLFGSLPFIEEPLENHGTTLAQDEYWSSTEADATHAFTLSYIPRANVRAGQFTLREKSMPYRVRAVHNLSTVIPPLPEPTMPDNIIETDCNDNTPQPFQGGQLLYQTPANINVYSTPVCGDIDNDGITDIVVAQYTSTQNYYHRHWSNMLGVYNGNDLSLQSTISIPQEIYMQYLSIGIARYPKDNGSMEGAVFAVCCDGKLRSYSKSGQLLNTSDHNVPCDGTPNFADFNGDGYPEVYVGNAIFDAATLKRLCAGPETGNKGLSHRGTPYSAAQPHRTYYAIPFACDVMGDGRLELICGNTIYDVNIVSRTTPALNSISEGKTITPPAGFPQDGHVVLADLDIDGEIDILVVNDLSDDITEDYNYFYAYKPSTGTVLFEHQLFCRATGYPAICNLDDDPRPEILFIDYQYDTASEKMYCLRYEGTGLNTVWTIHHHDPSGMTSMVFFDFNFDEKPEIVFRDAYHLNIINGQNGQVLYSYPMYSGTAGEHPIVADVNNDGHAEIIVPGLLEYYDGVNGHGNLLVFGNPAWQDARKVWNQYAYNVTNVNNDLTIPQFCFNNATTFTAPDGTVRRPYNNFLQQAYYINQYGEPYNPGGTIEADVFGSGCVSFTFHDSTYYQSGVYDQLVETSADCDTLYHVNVSIGGTVTHEFSDVFCGEYEWNDTVYHEPGDYTQLFVAPAGCDSIVTLHLTLDHLPATPVIEGLDHVFVATDLVVGQYFYSIDSVPFADHYEWILDGADWPMDTTGIHCGLWITSAGTATLTVRAWNDCGYSEQSIIIHAGFYDVDDFQDIPVALYPNPAKEKVYIEAEGIERVRLYDLTGRNVYEVFVNTTPKTEIDLRHLSSGLYVVEVITERGIARTKLDIETR